MTTRTCVVVLVMCVLLNMETNATIDTIGRPGKMGPPGPAGPPGPPGQCGCGQSGIYCFLRPPVNGDSKNCSTVHIEYGTTCEYYCDTGYFHNGTKTSTCVDANRDYPLGKFDPIEPTCELIHCKALKLQNGNSSCKVDDDIQYGKTCNYICNEGYYLNGINTAKCLGDHKSIKGKWNSELPSCQSVTCSTPGYSSNRRSSCTANSYIEYGQTCTLSCDQGYYLQGKAQVTCVGSVRYGAFSPAVQTCRHCGCVNSVCEASSQGGDFTCRCNTGFVKDTKTTCIRPKTCQHGYPDVRTASGRMIISPDGSKTATVNCVLSGSEFRTELGHNQESIEELDRWEDPQSFSRYISYNEGLDIAIGVADNSGSCRQYLKYACRDSQITWEGGLVIPWADRNGRWNRHFAGAKYDNSCPCYDTGSCTGGSSAKCNCDMNDATWREDSGYITTKSWLPVTNVYGQDTKDSGEYARITLGRLYCWGRA